MAENVSDGSVPMATATSILPVGRSPSGRIDPPELRAMISTAAEDLRGIRLWASARNLSRNVRLLLSDAASACRLFVRRRPACGTFPHFACRSWDRASLRMER